MKYSAIAAVSMIVALVATAQAFGAMQTVQRVASASHPCTVGGDLEECLRCRAGGCGPNVGTMGQTPPAHATNGEATPQREDDREDSGGRENERDWDLTIPPERR